MKKVVCYGEVLWDILPTERIAGGAPMNVCIRLQSLGINSQMISSIGNDSLGQELQSIIEHKHVDTSLLQINDRLATGQVHVTLNEQGSASYEIVYPSAWDSIVLTAENQKAVAAADAFVFGSLACRDTLSQETLLALLKVARYKIFDVNLRPPFYSLPLIVSLMEQADLVKLNDDELIEIVAALQGPNTSIEDGILFLSQITNTHSICVTKGKDGAVLYHQNQFYSHPGYEVTVVDTIGAGDSFLAALISKINSCTDYSEALAFACNTGAMVASHKGAFE